MPSHAADAFAQNRRIGRSVNIIGYDPIWKSPDQARFKEQYFRQLKQAGFDSVRINLHAFRHMVEAQEWALRESWWTTLDWAVKQATAQGLVAILDLHEFNAMADDPVGRRPQFLAFWRQVAQRYQDAPDSVIFEILNEPARKLTPALWNTYLAEALAIIRQSNPTRTVIVGPAFWNGIDHLKELELPAADRNLIVTVHYYQPMEFTHQGASWSSHKDKSGIVWKGTVAERQKVKDDFANVVTWAREQSRPIFLGEFGAYDHAPMDSRARYTDCVARTAEANGWSWAYWQFDSDFILYDIPQERWVEPILKALVPPAYAGKPFSDPVHKAGVPSIPGIIQSALYDLGGEGVAYHDTDPVNNGSGKLNLEKGHQRAHASEYVWQFRKDEGADISFVKDWADLNHTNIVSPHVNQFYLGWTEDGEWCKYTVNVARPGTYRIKCLYAYQPNVVSFDLNGRPAAICRLPLATASYHHWNLAEIGTIEFPDAGQQVLTFHYGKGNNFAYFEFEETGAKPSVATGKPLVLELWPREVPDEPGGIGPERVRMSPTLDRKQVEVTEPTRLVTDVTKPSITVYRPPKERDTETAMLICPGGGYWNLYWELEGEEVAAWLNSMGITGILLKYRVPRRPDDVQGEPARRPLQDAQRAVSLVRSRAKEWGINPQRIGMIGFSAGGHLAIATATKFEKRSYDPQDDIDQVSCRPDFAILAYPGYLKAKDKEELSPALHVPSGTPPVFLVHGDEDIISPPQHSVCMYLALKRAGIPAELHVYAGSAHDFAVRKNDHLCSAWTEACANWLRHQGFLPRKPTSSRSP